MTADAEENAFIVALLEEFSHRLETHAELVTFEQTDAIVVLSWEGYKNPEHASRLSLGIEMYKNLRDKIGIPPVFVINAETKQLPLMKEHAHELGMVDEILLLDCGAAGVANSKTQIEVLAADPRTKNLRRIILVTSNYHVPRVQRTASKILPIGMNFSVFGAHGHDSFSRIYGEINRIVQYSKKGTSRRTLGKKRQAVSSRDGFFVLKNVD